MGKNHVLRRLLCTQARMRFVPATVQDLRHSTGRCFRTAFRGRPGHHLGRGLSVDEMRESEDGDPIGETPPQRVQHAIQGVLNTDDAGTASRSPDELVTMIVVRVVYQTKCIREEGRAHALGQYPARQRPRCTSKRHAKGISRRPTLSNLLILSAPTRTLRSRSSVASVLRGHVSENMIANSTIDPTPNCL